MVTTRKRFLIHLLVLELVRLIDLKSRHALQVFEKCAAKRRVLVPIFCQDPLRDLLHHHDRAGNKRDAQQEDKSRPEAPGSREDDEERQRRDKRVEELRHILAKIALQLVYSLYRLLHDLRGGHLFPIAHAEPEELFVDQVAELSLDRAGRKVAHAHRVSCDPKSYDDRHQNDQKPRHRIAGSQLSPVESLRRYCDQTDHHRVHAELEPLQDYVSHNVFFAFRAQGHQPFVKHLQFLRSKVETALSLLHGQEPFLRIVAAVTVFCSLPRARKRASGAVCAG